jgi:hypothetical protein
MPAGVNVPGMGPQPDTNTTPAQVGCPLGPALPEGFPDVLAPWIRTPCGRAKYVSLAARRGPAARTRLAWFVLIAALRDLGQPLP